MKNRVDPTFKVWRMIFDIYDEWCCDIDDVVMKIDILLGF